tara:strand:- start:535 stop:948 length:414 start_codon:yes stop_codon:yes gene_type:complete
MIIEMLRKHEGVEKYAYKCTADKVTIGVGRNIDKSSSMGLSDDEIDYLLSNDIKRVSAELIRAFPWYSELDEVRKDAMIDMCFNMGLPRLSKFKNSLAAMKNGDYDIAALEFLDSNWAKQVGSRSITITDMIRSGEY